MALLLAGCPEVAWPQRTPISIRAAAAPVRRIAGKPTPSFHLSVAFFSSHVSPSGFFILGGICVSYGSASYFVSLFLLRRTMMLSFSAALLNSAAVVSVALFWLCAISLYIGRLEVEIIQEDITDKRKENGKAEK